MLYEFDIAEFIIVFFTSFNILEILQAFENLIISEIKLSVDTSIMHTRFEAEMPEPSYEAQYLHYQIYIFGIFQDLFRDKQSILTQ